MYCFVVLLSGLLIVWAEDLLNVSSPQFLEIAKSTYQKIIPCIKNGRFSNLDTSKWKFPDDAEEHYNDLLKKTEKFRGITPHTAAYYHGPWIENHFIDHFLNKPLSYFNGLIPLFIQWTDIHVHYFSGIKNSSIPLHTDMPKLVSSFLRKDVLYFALHQDDEGFTSKLLNLVPNIISMSAGGFGNIPIPLIKGIMDYSEPPKQFANDVTFYGTLRGRLTRSSMLFEMERCLRGQQMGYKSGNTPTWASEVLKTKFNLAPRGYGRTSYRLAEIIQMGRLPVYMFDDQDWFPYKGSNVSVEKFGFVGKMGRLCATAANMKKVTSEELADRLKLVHDVRYYYTYEGVLEQIELFFADPFGPQGGFLVCSKLPDRDHRRLINAEDLGFESSYLFD